MLDRWVLAGSPDSAFEIVVGRLLESADLPGPVFHHVLAGHEVDFAFPEHKVAVELDGWEDHGRRQAFESDRARGVSLAVGGWVVLRFTWWAITNRPGRFLDQLLARSAAA